MADQQRHTHSGHLFGNLPLAPSNSFTPHKAGNHRDSILQSAIPPARISDFWNSMAQSASFQYDPLTASYAQFEQSTPRSRHQPHQEDLSRDGTDSTEGPQIDFTIRNNPPSGQQRPRCNEAGPSRQELPPPWDLPREEEEENFHDAAGEPEGGEPPPEGDPDPNLEPNRPLGGGGGGGDGGGDDSDSDDSHGPPPPPPPVPGGGGGDGDPDTSNNEEELERVRPH
jgi:hypothetical protein